MARNKDIETDMQAVKVLINRINRKLRERFGENGTLQSFACQADCGDGWEASIHVSHDTKHGITINMTKLE